MRLFGWIDDWKRSYEFTKDLGRPMPSDIRQCYAETGVFLVCAAAFLAFVFGQSQEMVLVHKLLPSLSFMSLMVVAMPILSAVAILYDTSLDPPFKSFGEVMGSLFACGRLTGMDVLTFCLAVVMLIAFTVAASTTIRTASPKTHALNLATILATSLLFSPAISTFVGIVFKGSQCMAKAMGVLLAPAVYIVLVCVMAWNSKKHEVPSAE